MADAQNIAEQHGISFVTVILALVFLFWWPGPFRYEFRDSGTRKAVVKIDRISHDVYDFNSQSGKWVKR